MKASSFDTKKILATALIATGLIGISPAIGEEITSSEAKTEQEQSILALNSELCNQKFQCKMTGLVVHFLPNNKALFVHSDSGKILNADYRIHFNRDMAMNVYSNPSKHFDFMLHNIAMEDKGFSARVNREERYFQKV